MRRMFGWGKKEPEAPAAPPPSLNEASSRIGGRVDEMEAKIKKIDAQLIPMRAQVQSNVCGVIQCDTVEEEPTQRHTQITLVGSTISLSLFARYRDRIVFWV